jgi:replication-associated recombination protein RarA
LLPNVENANIWLIGAITHNPGFYLISPLLGGSHLFNETV